MFTCPYFTPNQYRSPEEISYLRIFHASPNAPAVDVYVNDKLIVRNLSYRAFTEYLKVKPGTYNVKLYRTGDVSIPIVDTNLVVENNKILTVAAIGLLGDIRLQVVEDTPMPIEEGKVMLRVAHFSPDAPNVNASINNSNVTFENVGFSEVTDYKVLNPGLYTMQATVTGTDDVVLIVPNINLKPNRFYTIYIIGFALGVPPLQVVIPLDGNSYIKF